MTRKTTRSIQTGVMELAADIIERNIEFNTLVLEQFEEKDPKSEHHLITIKKLRKLIKDMKQALDCINENLGCWQ